MKATGKLMLLAPASAVGVAASFDGNLNYRSPSLSQEHQGLGIDVPHVASRMIHKRADAGNGEGLRFTHGVASV